MSHDLKSPLAVISATAQLMQTTVQYMSDLVHDLLDIGKIESGLEVPNDEVDLVALIHDVEDTIRPQADAKDIVIAVDQPTRVVVTAIASRLKQALLNLAGNAIKYTPNGGRVLITTVVGHGGDAAIVPEVTVSVTDTGIGIAAASVPFLFDKFYRVETAATKSIRGTGLGGRIWVESEEGKGSTFSFALPVRR
jgi:signal transduction histidine kinase